MAHSVLLVDDERFARTVYSDYLRAAGFEVETAEGGEAALHLLRRRTFDVMVTDVIMPGADGLALLGDAKQIDPDMEVVVITHLDRVEPAVRAMKSGASDYLVKPVSPEALQLAVQRALSTRALLAENKALRSHLVLFETCQRITASLEREKLVPMAMAALAAETGASAAVLAERGPGGWVVTGERGLTRFQGEALLSAAGPLLAGLGPEVPPPLPLPEGEPRFPAPRAVCLPVGDGSQILGAAFLLLDGDLDFERAGRAAFLCRHVGLALSALGRLQKVESLAYLDDLTHLYNTRYLELTLAREVEAGRPFTVLFLDLDFFKSVNDAHGHLLGSRLLVEVARVLRACVRDEDVVARYGGDEFVAVLVGIDSGSGLKVAERIRRAVEEHRFLSREGTGARITASIGLASFPEHAGSRAEVLDLADRAMYRGKRTTRNVVYIASRDLPPVTGR
ncbi:MAG TPA: diguanylate cyclase [Anaeromyxobacteraceae bacterium]|nr:diguanylate cyclase [Anaeromyxobacteraceae bacterium]